MTAEIAIINKQGIALAADSAVTIGRSRVWQSANKLFSLSPYNDIGIMINGSGDFIGYPWETIVKYFRRYNGTKKYASVQDCADNFIRFLKSNKIHNSFLEKTSASFVFMTQMGELEGRLNNSKTNAEFYKKLLEAAELLIKQHTKNAVLIKTLNQKQFSLRFKKVISALFKENFGKALQGRYLKAVVRLCFEAYRRKVESDYSTGLVIAGFGLKEFFPVLKNYIIDGKYSGRARIWLDSECDLNFDGTMAQIMPFAQSDMFRLFLEGILPQNMSFILRSLFSVLNTNSEKAIKRYVKGKKKQLKAIDKQRRNNKEIIKKFREEFDNYKRRAFIDDIMRVVATLPKEEMAAMAEALVELTSLRRKIDSRLQSVGGPTDVAVISKGDGFIWIKRKHYFDINNNRDFMQRKALKISGAKP